MGISTSRIGTFDILRQIGSGGTGAVYLGYDRELDRQVAIKVIREEIYDQEVLDRFFREARAAAALRHPNIITIYGCGEQDHQPYIVMEFVDGVPIGEYCRHRPIPDRLALRAQAPCRRRDAAPPDGRPSSARARSTACSSQTRR